MLVNMNEIMKAAEQNGYAIACINTPNYVTLRAVVDAAEEVGVPIIIDHAEVHNQLVPIEEIGPLMVEYAKQAKVPVCVHLDHGVSYDFVMKAIRTGFSSIMYDQSALPFEENIRKVKEFVKIAHPLGISVEGELGIMGSTEEDEHGGVPMTNAQIRETFTDPEEARQFADETNVDALAVCFGTIHGIYAEDPKLDIQRVKDIRKAVKDDCRIVMHGGSGVDYGQTREAISAGISKINFYSYLSKSASENLAKVLKDNPSIPHEQLNEINYEFMKNYTKDVLVQYLNEKVV